MANVNSPVDFNKLSNLTTAINLIPNEYDRMAEYFPIEGSPRGAIIYDRTQEKTGMLSDTRNKGHKQLSGKDWKREVFTTIAPEFAYSDFIVAADVDRVRKAGEAQQPELLADLQARKLAYLKRLHSQTHEFMRVSALKGITTTPDGVVYANMFTEFNVTPKVINFDFSDADLDINGLCRQILRHQEDNALNGSWTGMAHFMTSPEFFDELVKHPKTFEAYNQYQNLNQLANAQVNRDDLGRKRFGRTFLHAGVMFEEYRATVNGTRFIEASVAYGFPEGLEGVFVTYALPPEKFSELNSLGQESYAWQYPVERDSQVEIESFSSVLPMCKRPECLVKLTLTPSV
jgi:hypothetical protein